MTAQRTTTASAAEAGQAAGPADVAGPAASPLLWLVLGGLLVATGLVSLGIGRYPVGISHTAGILLSQVFPLDAYWSELDERIVTLIRGPRVLIAVVAGAALAVSGSALQGIFSNPLVGPQIIGVSSGAAFGGALGILLFGAPWLTVALAFAGGLAAIVLVYGVSNIAGRANILSLVLGGVVVSAFFTALVSAIKYLADPEESLPAIVFWLMGSLASSTYERFWVCVVPVAVAGGILLKLRFRINVLSLGDEEAAALGVNVERTRWLVLVCVALCTAAVVSVSGVIGWVGLVMPHLARMLVGPDNRLVLPASALIGGTYLVIVDDVARAATSGEMPIGMITALIGTPVFGYLFWQTQKGRSG